MAFKGLEGLLGVSGLLADPGILLEGADCALSQVVANDFLCGAAAFGML